MLKSADTYAYVGDLVTYQIKVYNPSDHDLYNINVTDPMLGLNATIPFMAARNITGVTYTLQREVLETDPNPLVNTVYVEAIDSTGVRSSASTQAITTTAKRIISISKIGPETAYESERITYTITVNNTANFTITNVVVEDEMLGFSWKGDLDSGEVNIFNLTYTIPCCYCKENLTNTVSVKAEVNETFIYAEASWTTKILCRWLTHSIGYWKNHPEKWPTDEIEIGNITYTKEEALRILWEANARDATRMLAAQLIAAKLNRLSGASPCFYYCGKQVNIDDVIFDADAFLTENPIGSNPQGEDRQTALILKDILDAYNDIKCE
ncbi:MAG: hypothetical protein QW175_03390 [Candidatus Bathyarchaeia archaeon]